MQPSWLNNYIGVTQPYGTSQTIQPYGSTPIPPSSLGGSSGMDANMAMMALKMLKDNESKAAPMQQMQNSMPMGRPMSWQEIMKSYGITGLME